ncbi:OmpA family protein [Emticicia agri]|uniref:OmpA family protein n=1 Tax=Emticicia agri TaxID=2492393 RepID=A0A4Q5LU16_9BACT|nr:OmpA family protein [Emticicia agri]RYU92933.1 OmpA family protein [Emticicia agri]
MQRNIVSKSLVLAASLLAVGYTNMSCRSTGGVSGRDMSTTNDDQTTMMPPPQAQQASISTVSLGGASGTEIKRIMSEYVPALNENIGDIAMVETYDEGIIVTMNKGNIFDVNSYMINKEAKSDLLRVAYSLKQMPNTFVVVNGHTDATGSKEYNDKLSRKRAVQVANYLKGAGIDEKRLLVDGYGEKIPKYSNKMMTGRNKNRRVDFIIVADNELREDIVNGTSSIR